MLRLFAHLSAVVLVVVDVDVDVVVVSQLLHVLSHWCMTESQRLTASKAWHWRKGSVFLLFLHRCSVLVVEVLVLVVVVDVLVLVLVAVVDVLVLVLDVVVDVLVLVLAMDGNG